MTRNLTKISVLLLIVLQFSSCESKKDDKQTNRESSQCYERVTSGNGITDRLTLNVQFTADSIHGELLWLPQEKDSQRGTIKGIELSDSIFDVRYDYSGEGVSATEKQSIVFEKGRAIITRKGDTNSIDTLSAVACAGN